MKLEHLLSLVTIFLFVIFIFLSKNPRRFYLLFTLYLIPVMDLVITSSEWGSLRVFDGISYIAFVILLKEFTYIKKEHNIYYFLFCLFTIVLLFGSLTSSYVKNSLMAMLSVFPIFIYSKCIVNECIEDTEFEKKIVQCLQIVAVFSILFLALQMLIGLEFTFYSKLNRNTVELSDIRYPSFFHEPQKYGQFLAMLSFLFLINNSKMESPQLKNYLLFGIVVIAIFQTGGRSALIGLSAGLVLLFFFFGLRYKIILIAFFIAGIIGFLKFSDSLMVFNRSESFKDDYLFRASLWNEAYDIYTDHPFLGIGIGNFHEFAIAFSDNYFINSDNDVIFFDQPESGYWMILTEIGTLGFIISFLFIIVPILSSVKHYFNKNINFIVFLYIAPILSWLVSFVSVYSLYDKRILIVLITFICLLINARISHVKS